MSNVPLPLSRVRIAATRAKGQNEQLASRLRALGAEVLEMPTIEIVPAADSGALDRAIASLERYDWLIFTSVNGVRFFFDRADHAGVDLHSVSAGICAIGAATRAALEARQLRVDVTGKEYVAESLLAAFAAYDLSGRHVLLPRAAIARDVVPDELRRRGAHVDVVEAYRTIAPSADSILVGLGRKPDCITFTSASTVQNFVAAAGAGVLVGMKVASIGPITTKAARALGVAVTAEAKVFSAEGLVEAIVGLYTETSPP